MEDTLFTLEPWVAAHRGTRTDIKRGTDYFRVGAELEVADPDAVCIHVYGARKAEKAAHIVKCVNAHDDLIDALEEIIRAAKIIGHPPKWGALLKAERAITKARGAS